MDDPKYSLNHLPDNTKLSTIREILNSAAKEKAAMQSIDPNAPQKAPATPDQLQSGSLNITDFLGKTQANGLPSFSAEDVPNPINKEPSQWGKSRLGQAIASIPSDDRTTSQRMSDFATQERHNRESNEETEARLAHEKNKNAQAYANIPDSAFDKLGGSPISKFLNQMGSAPASLAGSTPLSPEQLALGNFPKAKTEEAPAETSPSVSGTAGVSPRGSVQQKPSITEQKEPATIPTSLEDTEMKAALEQAQANREHAGFRSSLADLSNAIIGTGGADMSKNRVSSLDRDLTNADRPLTDLNTKRDEYKKFLSNKEEKDKNDPNSAVSNTMRTALEEMGVKIPKNATYASMEKLAPQLMANQQMKDRMADRALARESLNSSKQDKVSEKERYHQDAYLQFATSKTAPIRTSYSAIQNAARLSSTSTKNPAEDITALYSFVKNLDPNSSVREGEVGLARDISSIQGKVQTYFNKVSNGDSLDSKTVDNLKKEILRMADSQKQSYNTEMAAYKAGAKNRGVPESRYVEFDPQHSTNDNAKTQTSSGLKKVTFKDGNVINVKESDLSQIDKADIAKVE